MRAAELPPAIGVRRRQRLLFSLEEAPDRHKDPAPFGKNASEIHFSLGLKISATIKPKRIAAEMPADAAEMPPVSAPSSPFSATASRTPLASTWPKPESGTVAPAPCKVHNGLIPSQSGKHHAQHHKSHQDPGRGELSVVDEDLSQDAEQSADHKGLEIF